MVVVVGGGGGVLPGQFWSKTDDKFHRPDPGAEIVS